MKIAILSDIHFGVRNDSKFFHDRLFEFLENVFFPYLKQNEINTLLILGDTWDRRKYVNFNTLHDVRVRFFQRLRDAGVAVKMIYGNHDVYFRNTNDVNSVDILAETFDNVEVVTDKKIFDFDGLKVGMISWLHSGNVGEGVEWIANAPCEVLCGHFEIKNFEMMRGHLCEHGFESGLFSRFELVLSGHFHIAATRENITYVGNPIQTNWGDYGLEKGFCVLDTETRELFRVRNPFDIYTHLLYDETLDIVAHDYEQYRDKIIRVKVADYEGVNRNKFSLFVDKLSGVAQTVEVQGNDISAGDVEGVEGEAFSADALKLFDQYVGSVDMRGLDVGRLRECFLDCYNETVKGRVLAE